MPIITAEDPCWELVTADGDIVESATGLIAHYRTRQEALTSGAETIQAVSSADSAHVLIEPRQREKPCVTATCDMCGIYLEDDEDGTHFEYPAVAMEIAKLCDWIILDNRTCCSEDCEVQAAMRS